MYIGKAIEVICKCSKEQHQHRFTCPLISLIDCSWWVPLLHPCWWDLFETVSVYSRPSHFALQVCSRNVVVLLLPVCGSLSVSLHCIIDSTTSFSQHWVFWFVRTVWRLVLFWSPSNWTPVYSMSWTQIWIFPPHKRSYCLGLWYAPFSYFLAQRML